MNSEIAEVLGAFIGDGWIESRKKAIYIMGDRTEDYLHYKNYLGPLFAKCFGEVNLKEISSWKVYGIVCYKRDIIEKAIKLGFQIGPKALVAEIPKTIMQTKDEEIMKSIVRGVFDTDGCIWFDRSRAKTSTEWKRTYHSNPEMNISSCSKKLLEQIKMFLDKLKIESKLIWRTKKGFYQGRNHNNLYLLKIRKTKEIERFFEIIGTNNPKHKTKYEVWKKQGHLPPRTTLKERLTILKRPSTQKQIVIFSNFP